MCLNHPCYESLNKFAASKPARIIFGMLLVTAVAFGCLKLIKLSKDSNAKLVLIPAIKGNLINFDAKDEKSFERITSKIDKFIDSYQKENQNLVECNERIVLQPGKSCSVDTKSRKFGICTKESSYGYSRGSPCIFLKIRKALDWVPNYVNPSDIPENMPEDLMELVPLITDLKVIWVSCDGENPADKENLGPINYMPERGFNSYYFPWKGQKGYLEPIIAINFERPKLGVAIMVKCTMWTQDFHESVKFALMVD